MSDLEFGPVELVLAAFEGDGPDAELLDAIADLVDAGTVRLLDLVLVRRDGDAVRIVEMDEAGIRLDVDELPGSGLAAHEDVEELAGGLEEGASAVLLVVELVWARHLASRLAASGGYVVDSVRIPAPAVNAVVADALTA